MNLMVQLAFVALVSCLGLVMGYGTVGIPYAGFPYMSSFGYGYTPFTGSAGFGGLMGGGGGSNLGGGMGGIFGSLIYLFLFIFVINILFSGTSGLRMGGQSRAPNKGSSYHDDHDHHRIVDHRIPDYLLGLPDHYLAGSDGRLLADFKQLKPELNSVSSTY